MYTRTALSASVRVVTSAGRTNDVLLREHGAVRRARGLALGGGDRGAEPRLRIRAGLTIAPVLGVRRPGPAWHTRAISSPCCMESERAMRSDQKTDSM